jgi:hypothetical protein
VEHLIQVPTGLVIETVWSEGVPLGNLTDLELVETRLPIPRPGELVKDLDDKITPTILTN